MILSYTIITNNYKYETLKKKYDILNLKNKYEKCNGCGNNRSDVIDRTVFDNHNLKDNTFTDSIDKLCKECSGYANLHNYENRSQYEFYLNNK